MIKPVIQLNRVTKTYMGKTVVHALRGVSLDIYQGEILGLLGANGAGKTTLSSILATLHPLSSGDVLYKGVSIYTDLSAYKKNLGFCPQQPNLDQYLNVEQNLIFAGRYFLMPLDEVLARTEFLLNRFGLSKYRDFDIKKLSGGYKQRVLIARAMVHSPQIIILDEPTVGLDPDVRHDLWEIIKELRHEGITIILTTHYLDEAEYLSDRVCLLAKGQIVMTGSVLEFKQRFGKATLEEAFLESMQESHD